MQPATWDEHAKPPAQDTALHWGVMQPVAEQYSITVTNSSSTRSLNGRGPPTHLAGARMQADGLATQSSRSAAPAKPMFHAKQGSGTLPVHF